MIRRSVLWFLIIVFIVVFGAMAVGGVVSSARASRNAPHETATATGTVTAAGSCGGRGSNPGRAVFTVEGSQYRAEVSCKAHVGDRVKVKYDPADPSHNNDARNSTSGYAIAAVGLVGLALSVPSLIRQLRKARRTRGPGGAGSRRLPRRAEH